MKSPKKPARAYVKKGEWTAAARPTADLREMWPDGERFWGPMAERLELEAGRMRGLTPTFSYRAAFARLWDGIYAGRGFGWDADPWVWVIGFRVAEVRR